MKTRHELYGHEKPVVDCPQCIASVLAEGRRPERADGESLERVREAVREERLRLWPSKG